MQPDAGLALHRFEQQAVQVGAVDGGVGRAVARPADGPQTEDAQRGRVVRVAHLQRLGKGCAGAQRTGQAPGLKHPDGVGTKLQTGPHLTERGGLLQQVHPHASARQGQRTRQPPDAAPGDDDLLIHGGDCAGPPSGGVDECQGLFTARG